MEQGVIYILTNPSFPDYIKIGYATDLERRLRQLNRSETIPFAFRAYAIYEVESNLTDVVFHDLIDRLNPDLRSIETFAGRERKREFYAMSPEDAHGLLKCIAKISGTEQRLKKMTPVAFESVLDGEKCGFQYVASGNEIYAFNYTGGITEIFSYYKNGIIYGVREEKNATKGYLVEINLAEKTLKKISGGNMICNFVMSPEGSKILCNHRGDGYWSVFDIASKTEKKISQKLVNGYARTTEIEFLDENRILTYGESIFKNSTEEDSTCVVNLQTMRIEKKYSGVGLVNMKWSYRYHHKKKSLEFYEITGNQSFTIPDVKDSGDVIDVSGDYVLFGNLEEKKQAVYLVQLTNHTWKKMNIPRKLRNDMEIHLVKTQKKILITNKKRAYLVDVSAL